MKLSSGELCPNAQWDWIGVTCSQDSYGLLSSLPEVQSIRRVAGGSLAVKLHNSEDPAAVLTAVHASTVSRMLGVLQITRLDLCEDLDCDIGDVLPALGDKFKAHLSGDRITWAIRGDIRRMQRCIYDKALQLGESARRTRCEVRVGADWLGRYLPSRDLPTTAGAIGRIRLALAKQLHSVTCGIPVAEPLDPARSTREAYKRQSDALRLLRLASAEGDRVVASRLATSALQLAPHLLPMANHYLLPERAATNDDLVQGDGFEAQAYAELHGQDDWD